MRTCRGPSLEWLLVRMLIDCPLHLQAGCGLTMEHRSVNLGSRSFFKCLHSTGAPVLAFGQGRVQCSCTVHRVLHVYVHTDSTLGYCAAVDETCWGDTARLLPLHWDAATSESFTTRGVYSVSCTHWGYTGWNAPSHKRLHFT